MPCYLFKTTNQQCQFGILYDAEPRGIPPGCTCWTASAQETSRWREEMSRHREFLELEWERRHGIVREKTETIEEEPVELTEEEEILSSETDEQAGW